MENCITAGTILGCNGGETLQPEETTALKTCCLTTKRDFNDVIKRCDFIEYLSSSKELTEWSQKYQE